MNPTISTDEKNWNDYLIPGTDVLKNNFDTKNKEKLKRIETFYVKEKLAILYLKPIKGNFDMDHLLNMHKFIFEEVYPFAGKLRTCSLQKDTHVFCEPDKIKIGLKEVLKEMNDDFNNNDFYSKQDFAFKLAEYYYNLIYIHPFREGNGRCIRAFIRDFVVEKSKNKSCGQLDLDFTKIDAHKLMLGTALKYIYGSYLVTEFINGLVPYNKKTK